MKKLIITGTLLLTVIAGSTSSYATSCTPDVWGGGYTCKGYSKGSVTTTTIKPDVWGGGFTIDSYTF